MTDLFHPDSPIRIPEEDKLGRNGLAVSIAAHLRQASVSEGFVVGLLGPWGCGKSSILNLTEFELQCDPNVRVVRFNPWLFSGTQDLLTRFFSTVGSELKLQEGRWAKSLGEQFESYGELLLPLEVIPWAGALPKFLVGAGRLLKRKNEPSIHERRTLIRSSLAASPVRLVFILDDIDRLHDAEILEVMRLVRLVGDFPKCIYVLAFDQDRVAEALGREGGNGRAYLEKILQMVFEVPAVRRTDIHEMLIQGIGKAEDTCPHGPFDAELWQNVYGLGMLPLFRKIRDVRRYLNVLPVTMKVVGEEVALVDVLALEAIRVLRPDLYAHFPEAVLALTHLSSGERQSRSADAHKEIITDIVDKAGQDRTAIEEIIVRLFPAVEQYLRNTHHSPDWLKRWSRERKVAHERVLRFYLERSYPARALTNATVQEFFETLADEQRLSSLLDQLSPKELESMLERLEDYEDEYPPESVQPALRSLFNQLPRLSDEAEGMFSYSPQMKLQRVIYRLLRRVAREDERESVIEDLYAHLKTLDAKVMLVLMSGHRRNTGHGFVSVATGTRLEQQLAKEIAEASPEEIATLDNPLGLYYRLKEWGTADQVKRFRKTIDEDKVFLAMLAGSMRNSWSQTMGDVATRAESRLPWTEFEEIYGAEALRGRIKPFEQMDRSKHPEKTVAAVELAHRYAEGWRPRGDFPAETVD